VSTKARKSWGAGDRRNVGRWGLLTSEIGSSVSAKRKTEYKTAFLTLLAAAIIVVYYLLGVN